MQDPPTYPTWPFTRLTPQQMAAFDKAHQQKRKEELAKELGESLL